MTAAPVSYFVPDSFAKIRNMRARLEEERERLKTQLTLAYDWPDFKYRCGQIDGIEKALVLCAEIDKEMRN